MNYLAHAYLTGNRSDEVLMGNMMGDFIKGPDLSPFKPTIQQGIQLHRKIDEYTDRHFIVREIKKIFRPDYNLFSGIIADTILDYFLASDPKRFTHESLRKFSDHIYKVLGKYSELMNEKMSYVTGYMIRQDWLYHYKDIEGISDVLRRMSRRIDKMGSAERAIQSLIDHESNIRSYYEELIVDLENEFM